jgi:hypothetical protein
MSHHHRLSHARADAFAYLPVSQRKTDVCDKIVANSVSEKVAFSFMYHAACLTLSSFFFSCNLATISVTTE